MQSNIIEVRRVCGIFWRCGDHNSPVQVPSQLKKIEICPNHYMGLAFRPENIHGGQHGNFM
jgi:hypothetical protein